MAPKEIFDDGGERALREYGIIDLPGPFHAGLSNKQRRFLTLACRQAEVSELANRHGCVVVRGGRVLAMGINKWRNQDMVTHSSAYSEHLSQHAEMDALSRVKDPRGATIYIARVDSVGRERFSRPCDRCAKALTAAGVKQIIYTIGD